MTGKTRGEPCQHNAETPHAITNVLQNPVDPCRGGPCARPAHPSGRKWPLLAGNIKKDPDKPWQGCTPAYPCRGRPCARPACPMPTQTSTGQNGRKWPLLAGNIKKDPACPGSASPPPANVGAGLVPVLCPPSYPLAAGGRKWPLLAGKSKISCRITRTATPLVPRIPLASPPGAWYHRGKFLPPDFYNDF